MAAELGHAAEARQALETLAADAFAHLPVDETWLAGISLLADTASKLGDQERAADLYDLLLPWEDRVAVSYADFSVGAVARYLGLLAAVMERWDDAERHFEAALEINEGIGARPWLAHAERDYAGMLRARDEPGDRERSRELLNAADTAYAELGMPITGPAAGTPPSSP
jgi:tetratricopeptide (TPR) repeat protein